MRKLSEQRWNSRPGCWEAIKHMEKTQEHEFNEQARDLFEFAYQRGYDKHRVATANTLQDKLNDMEYSRMFEMIHILRTIPQNPKGHKMTGQQQRAANVTKDEWFVWLNDMSRMIERTKAVLGLELEMPPEIETAAVYHTPDFRNWRFPDAT